jgi:hypothetical protein
MAGTAVCRSQRSSMDRGSRFAPGSPRRGLGVPSVTRASAVDAARRDPVAAPREARLAGGWRDISCPRARDRDATAPVAPILAPDVRRDRPQVNSTAIARRVTKLSSCAASPGDEVTRLFDVLRDPGWPPLAATPPSSFHPAGRRFAGLTAFAVWMALGHRRVTRSAVDGSPNASSSLRSACATPRPQVDAPPGFDSAR